MNRVLLCLVGFFAVSVGVQQQAGAQFYRFGPGGSVSINSPFFSLNVPTGPGYLGYRYGPTIAVPPIPPLPAYRSYHYRYPVNPYRFGYSYRPFGYSTHPYSYYYSPGVSSFYFESTPGYLGPSLGSSLYLDRVDDPYTYRGNVITPNDGADAYSVGRPPIEDLDPTQIADDLRIAAERLRQSLSLRLDDGDVWLNYLNPDGIIDALDETVSPREQNASLEALEMLIDNYDGVAGNPDLSWIASSSGFALTRQLLPLWLEQARRGGADENESQADASQDGSDANADSHPSDVPLPNPEPDTATNSSDEERTSTRRSL